MFDKRYHYYGQTTSLCEECLAPVQAKIIFANNCVYYLKYCPTHKYQTALISTDIAYFKQCRNFYTHEPLKPQHYFGTIEKGCPFDCGLCDDHEQHTAMAIMEVLDECNLRCPTCIAASAPGAGNHRNLKEIDSMLNMLVKSEGHPDLLMISGGEPTIHSDIIDIVKLAKSKPIKHIMLITNGLRIAKDKAFVQELKALKDNLEIYLQFDSLTPAVTENIRGENLKDIRLQAIANLDEAGIHSTLICVVKKNLNDHEVNDVIEFALQFKYIRGVTFQPCKEIGRSETFDKATNYITLSEVRKKIIKTSKYFTAKEMLPHPLNPENICIGYLSKKDNKISPVTSTLFRENQQNNNGHLYFENASALKTKMYFLPELNTNDFSYENLFRVTIVSFLDKYNFCTSSVKRSSIHFLTRDNRLIPIDTYYLLYQNQEQNTIKIYDV